MTDMVPQPMLKRLPPLHCLQALDALARRGSVADAADELAVTPSAVSHRLRQLEELVGQPLLARSQPVTLTAYGMHYLGLVRQALRALDELPAPRSNARTPLRVAMPPTFARNLLVPHLSEFTAAHPDIELELQLTIPLLDVKGGESDLEVRFGSGAYADAQTVEVLLNEPVFAVAAPALLARCGRPARPIDLQRLPLLRSPLEPWRPWFIAAGLEWPEPREGVQFNDLGLLMEAAVAGQGAALARSRLAQRWLDAGLLVRLFDLQAASPHAYWLLHDAAAIERPAARIFVDWLRGLLA